MIDLRFGPYTGRCDAIRNRIMLALVMRAFSEGSSRVLGKTVPMPKIPIKSVPFDKIPILFPIFGMSTSNGTYLRA